MNISISQNFLKSRLIPKVFSKVELIPSLPVLDIGAGTGNITDWLLKNCKNRIIVSETDANLVAQLKTRFANTSVKVIGNFFDLNVGEQYQVVANIPFSKSSAIFEKLLSDKFFVEGWILIQKEFAETIGGHQLGAKSTLKSILYANEFEIKVIHEFNKADFLPNPRVNIVFVHIKRLKIPQISNLNNRNFKNFVTHLFQYSNPNIRRAPFLGRFLARKIRFDDIPLMQSTPSELTFADYKKLFLYCNNEVLAKISESTVKHEVNVSKTQKIFRTRKAQNWNDRTYHN